MFYSDKPIQSIAPVRKAYLDGYPGEILYLERQFNWEFTAPSDEEIEEAADELSVRLSPGEIDRLRDSLSSRFAQERTEPRVEEMVPSLMPLSPLEEAIMRRTRLRGEEGGNEEEGIWNARSLPFARGYRIRSASDLWQIFFYRLVGPDARSGAGFNGAERLWKGCAYFIPSSNLVAFYSESPLVPRVSETTSASRTAETPAPLVP
jgi:hypothetical protein